jgi:hypothetical protein
VAELVYVFFASKKQRIKIGTKQPVLSDAESFYQRMLARDPVEAVEQAKSFMARHSLCDYCDEVIRPALMLALKDAERGILEEGNAKILRETVDCLFTDIAHEHWVTRKEAYAAILAPPPNSRS